MPEKRGNGKGKRILKSVFAAVGTAMIMALIYVAAVLLQFPADAMEGSFVVEDDEIITRMQPAETDDAESLAAMFGAPLPMLPGYAPKCQAGNTTHDGQTVRVAALQYDGLMITAVRPASIRRVKATAADEKEALSKVERQLQSRNLTLEGFGTE